MILGKFRKLFNRNNNTVENDNIKYATLFNTPDERTVVKKMKDDQSNFSKSLAGGNIHMWLTFGNGLIIDPSISSTVNKINNVLIGFPEDLKETYIYEPYTFMDVKDVGIYKQYSMHPNKDDIMNLITTKYNQMKNHMTKQSINGYY